MSHLVEKPPRLWLYFFGFNITILAGLFALVFGRLLGRWQPCWVSRSIRFCGRRSRRPARPASPETLDAVQDYNVLRTDQHGSIVLTLDGEQIWVQTYSNVVNSA